MGADRSEPRAPATVHLRQPITVLVIPGLTMTSVSEEQLAAIRSAAPPGSTVRVAAGLRNAIAQAGDVDVILGHIPEELFVAAPRLRWVHLIAAGVDAYLHGPMRESDVVLTSEKGLVGSHLADTGFGLLLGLTRQIAAAIRLGPAAWSQRAVMRPREIELEGLTMGIIGLGGTGRAMAQRAVGFGMNLLAVDVEPVAPVPGLAEVWDAGRLDDLLAASDVVAVCCPLTRATRNLLDDRAFSLMKRGALVVNVTRGEIIDGDALLHALRDGRCGGAALDVVPGEPLPADHPLFALDNVVMTPHTAGASQYRADRNIARFCENLRRAQRGEPFEGVVDKDLGY